MQLQGLNSGLPIKTSLIRPFQYQNRFFLPAWCIVTRSTMIFTNYVMGTILLHRWSIFFFFLLWLVAGGAASPVEPRCFTESFGK